MLKNQNSNRVSVVNTQFEEPWDSGRPDGDQNFRSNHKQGIQNLPSTFRSHTSSQNKEGGGRATGSISFRHNLFGGEEQQPGGKSLASDHVYDQGKERIGGRRNAGKVKWNNDPVEEIGSNASNSDKENVYGGGGFGFQSNFVNLSQAGENGIGQSSVASTNNNNNLQVQNFFNQLKDRRRSSARNVRRRRSTAALGDPDNLEIDDNMDSFSVRNLQNINDEKVYNDIYCRKITLVIGAAFAIFDVVTSWLYFFEIKKSN